MCFLVYVFCNFKRSSFFKSIIILQKVRSLEITKNKYKKTQKFSSIEIKELSLLYIILNNLDFFYHRLDLLNDLLFFSKENKILFQLVEQSLKNGNYNNIDIDKKYLDNINKFATVKHIVKKMMITILNY